MTDTLDPSKYHVLTNESKKNLTFIIILIVLLLMPLLTFVYYKIGVHRPSQTEKEVTFEIKKGASIFEIADGLYEKDAINSEFLFLLYTFANRMDKNIQAGTYTIKAGSTVVDVAEQFMHGTNDIKVTFLEGWRVEEIAREAEKQLSDIDYNKFVTAATPYEGYLFPDTYFFRKDVTVEDLVQTLSDTFNSKTMDVLSPQSLSKVGLSKEQVVTLASIIEREVTKESDKSLVAGILIKRLNEDMKLDADSTVQYAVAFKNSCGAVDYCTVGALIQDERNVDWWPSKLTVEDLDYTSPYNTRKNLGLPPTPISSVSLSSLNAVVNAQTSDFYYYLHDPEGGIHYAKTLEDHNLNIQKFLNN